MNILKAQYNKDIISGELTSITIYTDDVIISTGIGSDDRFYKELMRQVEEGTLTIQEAEQ